MISLKPRLLVSIWSVDEVAEAVDGGADIIDVKDPSTGSLGLPPLDIVYAVAGKVKGYREVSVAVGDVREYSQALSYVVCTLSLLNIDYVKVGIEMDSFDKALYTVNQIRKVAELYGSKVGIVLVGYADWRSLGVLEPLEVIELAKTARIRAVMIDTRIKNGRSTFDHLSLKYLSEFVAEAHRNSLLTAIAGGLKIEHLSKCVSLGFDIVGVRTAACSGDRLGRVSREAVSALKREIERLYSGRVVRA